MTGDYRVLVSLVTFNSARWLRACLESLQRQTLRGLTVCVWDNASEDDTLQILADCSDLFASAHYSTRNVGFCAAHNRVISDHSSDFVLVLNPDVVLEPDFMELLTSALAGDERAGSATGRLWRWNGAGSPLARPDRALARRILDSTGIYFTPAQRHFDRGSGEPDGGRFDKREYVFGASGAAALYRRRMLEEVRSGGEYFDEAFFAYREDADLAWRAQWLGWRCLYVPEAHGYHIRQVLPERRSRLPREINMHSFKNRFLMRIKNMDAGTYARHFVPVTARDLAAVAYVLAREQYSLKALPLLVRALPKAIEVRRALKRHRRVRPQDLRAWFAWKPVSRPIDQ
jgi:GT2 family glycosyltransferase